MSNKTRFASLCMSTILATSMLGTVSYASEVYTVKTGDALYKIAAKYGTTWQELAKINGLKNPNRIYPGQKIVISTKQEVVSVKPATPLVPAEIAPEKTTNSDQVTLTILGTTDTHGNIVGYSYEDGKYTEKDGLTKVATYVNSVRAENPYTLLLDNGDTLQGNILTDDIYSRSEDKHPVIAAMNYMKYDAMTLGNHEFNFGLDLIDKTSKEAQFPFLAANAYTKDGENYMTPYLVKEFEDIDLKVGIIGLTNPNLARWDGDKVESLEVKHLGQEARKYADILKEKEDIDVLIVTSHTGYTAEFDEEKGTDAASEIISLVPETDVLLLGHTHSVIERQEGNTVIGEAKSNAGQVVQFDLTLEKENGEWEVANREVKTVSVADQVPDKALEEIVKSAHEATISYVSGGGTGDGEDGQSGILGKASADFQPENEIKGIPEGKVRDTAVMDLINDVQLKYSNADVSSAALFKDTSDILAGDITYATLFNIYKFANELYVVEVTGKELKAYMEWSAACYNQAMPGDVSVSFNPDKPGYLYDMFAGVDYKIDLSKPEGERIVDLTFKGQPVKEDQTFNLALNNYRYSGLKEAGIISGKKHWESSGKSIRDYLKMYIEEQGTISPAVDNNWEIIGVDFNHPQRNELIKMVENGVLETPYDKALNISQINK
ncbi:MAG: 5'-nucleotidase C-terminal domain-containing protein [Cellulosilyticaceae bacterium]